MSEELVIQLMNLFGFLAKQGGGATDVELDFVTKFLRSSTASEIKVQKYLKDFIDKASEPAQFDETAGHVVQSVKDSMQALKNCRTANKVLNKEERVVVLVRMFEMEYVYVRAFEGKTVTAKVFVGKKRPEAKDIKSGAVELYDKEQPAEIIIRLREEVLKTAGETFKVPKDEIDNIRLFCSTIGIEENAALPMLDKSEYFIVDTQDDSAYKNAFHTQDSQLSGYVATLRISRVELYFLKYQGPDAEEQVAINGVPVRSGTIYPIPSGGFVKTPKGMMFYTDIVGRMAGQQNGPQISFDVNHMWFNFPNGNIGLRDVNLSEKQGTLVGIMGASGAGKTTLLNVLCGNEAPSEGEVLINGINLHTQKEQLEGVIGLIPQDDLLIEELTVYQNLYYSAKLCFKSLSEKEINERVEKTLRDLGLYERKDLQVGSPLNKMISGGQRKRLNIALELIREPAVLFVDEPTSGLSSRDSENVMQLLKELSLKGKLVFVVIHQPSSVIYQMFNKMFILDTGGYPVYYGNPTYSISYFKTQDGRLDGDEGQCPHCGNVNPEEIFDILDAGKLNEKDGSKTDERKKSPEDWNIIYNKKVASGELTFDKVETVSTPPPKSLDIPSWFRQFIIYTKRDFWAKLANTQYIALNILEAPILGFVLAYLIRYIVDPDSDIYIFRENANIPIYIFMAVVVAIFFGLIVSAEEIFKDAKILKREKFLNLSRSAYLMSKIVILMGLSAIQMLLFIVVGNAVISFQGMNLEFWLMLFAVSVSSNILGLIISSTFNSIVTIYIMIPLIMIPQMVLGGAMFTFDKLNKDISAVDKVPLIAEVIPARYAYEGLIVYQYKNNNFESVFFDDELLEHQADFKTVYYLPRIKEVLADVRKGLKDNEIRQSRQFAVDVDLLHNELGKEMNRKPEIAFPAHDKLTVEDVNEDVLSQTEEYIKQLNSAYAEQFLAANGNRERKINFYLENQRDLYNRLKNEYYNESVSDVVTKTFDKNKILRDGNRLIQIKDPIYQIPEPEGILRFRCHFFAPKKYFFGFYIETLWFNILSVWLLSAFLYVVLYYDWCRRGLEYLSNIDYKYYGNKCVDFFKNIPAKITRKNKKEEAEKKEGEAEAKSEVKTDAKAEVKTPAKTETKTEVKREAKASAKAEVKTEAKAPAKSEEKTAPKPDNKPDTKA